MRIQELRVTCQKCDTVFDAEIVVDAPVAVAVASMEAVRCECGSHEVGLGGAYGDAPPLTSPVAARAAWWHSRGAVGLSSETIYRALTGVAQYSPSVPHDPSDFWRCKQLLDLIPEWRSQLDRVAAEVPAFSPFVERWDEMEKLYEEEAPTGRCLKLYKLMQQLQEPEATG